MREEKDMIPWKRLAEKMIATGKYNPCGLDAETLRDDCDRGLAVVKWDDAGETIVAHGSLEATKLQHTWQVRKLYAAKEHCGNGNGSTILTDIVRRLTLIVPGPVTYFAITDNPKVVTILTGHGFHACVFAMQEQIDIWLEATGFDRSRMPDNALLANAARSGMEGRVFLMGYRP